MTHPHDEDPLQGRIDAELRRGFAVPAGAGQRVAASVLREARRAPAPEPRRLSWPSLAAAALIGAVGTWLAMMATTDVTQEGLPPRAPLPAGSVYAQLVGSSEGGGTCASETMLGDVCGERFGERLVLDPCVPVVGPLACERWPSALAVAVQNGPTPVMLLVDQLDRDPGIQADPANGLWVERYELGELVLYQISEHGSGAACLPLLDVRLEE